MSSPKARTVRAQAGLVLGELDRETQAFGLAVPAGFISHTGLAGLTLDGGIRPGGSGRSRRRRPILPSAGVRLATPSTSAETRSPPPGSRMSESGPDRTGPPSPPTTSVYVHFLMDEGEERIRQAYGAKYDLVKTLKHMYEPDNFFVSIRTSRRPSSRPGRSC